MRRIDSRAIMVLICFGLVISMMPAAAQDDNTIKIDDVTLQNGATTDVPIQLLNSTGVGGLQLTFTFNQSLVNATIAVAGDFNNSTVFSPDYSNVSDGILRVTCMKEGENLTGDLIIATVTLKAVGTSGSCGLNLSAELTNRSGVTVPSNVANGTFTISELANMTVTATPSSVTANTSSNVVFNVTSNGTSVSGATVTLSGAFSNVSTTGADGKATIAVNATSTGTINVTATKDGYAAAETTVTVSASGYDSADTNQDCVVSLTELMAQIGRWKIGTIGLSELMTSIGRWKVGSGGYC